MASQPLVALDILINTNLTRFQDWLTQYVRLRYSNQWIIPSLTNSVDFYAIQDEIIEERLSESTLHLKFQANDSLHAYRLI